MEGDFLVILGVTILVVVWVTNTNFPKIFRKKLPSVDATVYTELNSLFSRKISFYKYLNKDGKDKFIDRTQAFNLSKEWVGYNDFIIKQEHKALISACAIQVTFGLDEFTLSHIKRIFIAPSVFYSRLMGRDVKGLTMPIAIYLSWEDCEKGMDVNDDAFNLCLHEFAHALELSTKVKHADTDNNYIGYLDDWDEESDRVFEKINSNDNYDDFLREYAKVNKHEFFAVCVEHFFEKSASFMQNDPALFFKLCQLLNVNPLNTTQNYSINGQA